MSIAGEVADVVAVLERRQAKGEDVGEMLGIWRARAIALEAAPVGAGWEWLAAHGDASAARARDLCALEAGDVAESQARERPGS